MPHAPFCDILLSIQKKVMTMKKTDSIAEIYLSTTAISLLDILSFAAMIVSVVIFFINFWIFAPLVISVVLFTLSRSSHVSDKEFDKLLDHLLAFNPVREARSEEYEKLLAFHEQGYLANKALGEFYLGGFDLSKSPVRRGEDKEWRSALYHLSHLKFSEGRLDVYTVEADLIAGTVNAVQYALRLPAEHKITEATVTCPTGKKTVYHLVFPDCPPIPVTENSEELESLLSYLN